jgi:hypothetical protein
MQRISLQLYNKFHSHIVVSIGNVITVLICEMWSDTASPAKGGFSVGDFGSRPSRGSPFATDTGETESGRYRRSRRLALRVNARAKAGQGRPSCQRCRCTAVPTIKWLVLVASPGSTSGPSNSLRAPSVRRPAHGTRQSLSKRRRFFGSGPGRSPRRRVRGRCEFPQRPALSSVGRRHSAP